MLGTPVWSRGAQGFENARNREMLQGGGVGVARDDDGGEGWGGGEGERESACRVPANPKTSGPSQK